MRVKSVQQVMAVLPHRFDDDQWGRSRNIAKYFHPALLAVDKTMLPGRIIRMPAPDFAALAANRFHDGLFGALLRGPAFLIGGKTQISIGDKDDRLGHAHILPSTFRRRLLGENAAWKIRAYAGGHLLSRRPLSPRLSPTQILFFGFGLFYFCFFACAYSPLLRSALAQPEPPKLQGFIDFSQDSAGPHIPSRGTTRGVWFQIQNNLEWNPEAP